MIKDQLHVVHARAGGLDVHKMQISAAIRICQFGEAAPRCETRTFSALPGGIEQLVGVAGRTQDRGGGDGVKRSLLAAAV